MNSGLKSLLLLVALAAIGFGLYSILGDSGTTPAPLPTQTTPKDPTPQHPPVTERTTTPDAVPAQPSRTQVEQPIDSGKDYGQGLRGTLVNEVGQPVADSLCQLYIGSGAKDLMSQMMMMQRGIVPQPIATAKSDEHGVFQLGVQTIEEGKVFELHVSGASHVEYNQPNITLFSGRWWDVGAIKLGNGLVVHGRVVAEQSGQPINGATVELKNTTQGFGFSSIARTPGVTAITDASGAFRFENATAGQATIIAYAAGFARQEKTPALVRADADNSFDFQLPPGLSIAGVITDTDGKGLPNASYQVLSLAPKSPISVDGTPDRDGRFEVIGLVEGPYQMIVTAPDHTRKDVKPVMAGETDRQIVMERQGKVRVKVVARNGRLIDRYNLTPKSWQSNMPGNMLDKQMVRVNPRDLDNGFYTAEGFNPGNYVVQINASGFAMTFSEPFEIKVGAADPDVTVELLEGGSLSGSVVGADGTALAGVGVQTKSNDWEDNSIMAIFGQMVPVKISMMDIKTNPRGEFRMEKLTPGTYQILFQHPDYTTTSVRDVEIRDGDHTDLPLVRMIQGTLVSGTVMVDGVPAPQVKVQVSTAPDPNRKDARGTFTADTVSDERGQFVLPKRFPPGRYQATAGRQGNPFLMVVDYQQTKQEFELVGGQPTQILQFSIRAQ